MGWVSVSVGGVGYVVRIMLVLALLATSLLWYREREVNVHLRETVRLHKELRVLEKQQCRATYDAALRSTQLVHAMFRRLGVNPDSSKLEAAAVGGE